VALGTDDVQAAGGQHLVVDLLPLGLERGDAGRLFVGRQRLVVADRAGRLFDVAAEHDVGAAARHVGGDGDHAGAAGFGDDLGFARVLLGIEHLVRQLFLVEQAGKQFRVLDRGGADQHRLAALVAGADVGDDGRVLLGGGAVDLVVLVLADHRPVGRDDHGFQAVDLLEFVGLGVGRAGHAGELAVHAEIVLEGDRGQGLVLGLDRHAFLGLDRLVQAVRPAPARHQAAGEFVDDHHLAVLHHVLLVAVEQVVRPQGGVEVMDQQDVRGLVQAAALGEDAEAGEDFLGLFVAGLGQQHRVRLEVDDIVAGVGIALLLAGLALGQERRHGVHAHVEVGVVFGLAGDDQAASSPRRSGSNPLRRRWRSSGRAAPARWRYRPCCRAGSRSRTRCWCRR
jgi:hypothetical protein